MYTPVRKPVTRSKGRVVGHFASHKNRRMLPWESQLERDFLMSLEVDPGVLTFGVQPKTFEYDWDGSTRRYTPDVYVQYEDGEAFVEVKAAYWAAKPKKQAFFDRMTRYFDGLGYAFHVVTEDYIRREPHFSNTQLILAHRIGISEELDRWELLDLFEQSENLPLRRISSALCSGISPMAGLRYVAAGLATVDLNQPITPETSVSLRKGGYSHD